MADTTTIVPMAHERKAENLRAFMVNLANSRGLLIPESRLFEQRFLDLCLSRAPDHPTYSAMIFTAITELNESGGSCEEAISEFIKSKYESLPFAHTSLLSHHLAKLVEKKEILCDYNSHCYALPGTDDAERKSVEMPLIMNDQCAADEVMSLQNDKGTVEERILTESRTSPKRKACGGNDINFIEVSDTGGKACLSVTTVKTRSIEGVAVESEVALEKSGGEGRIEANSEGGELHELVVVDEQNDVLIEESCKGEENLRERTSNTVKEACEEGKSVAYKRLWESQTEACSNIIALEKMLKQCREKDQQKKVVIEIDGVSRLPLSKESCEELRKLAQKIESQLSEIIDSYDEAVVPCYESRGCETEGISKEVFHETPMKTSKQHEQKEIEIDSQINPRAKKRRVRRLQDIGKAVLRKSPRLQKLI
ncbi:hypothetical protein BRARA_J02398 [Brassica rapa]|uniref:H15 domain-containing protein n=2 Tax=Brassica campestris TaxID=3711 RepID=A0A397XN01_BRACM|nr:hypothetical protein IGI04_041734 [Brassica rapa subsp. trilocularis]RID42519.1 hypothetical protein BRARA_J02398 [Brassica rapa]